MKTRIYITVTPRSVTVTDAKPEPVYRPSARVLRSDWHHPDFDIWILMDCYRVRPAWDVINNAILNAVIARGGSALAVEYSKPRRSQKPRNPKKKTLL